MPRAAITRQPDKAAAVIGAGAGFLCLAALLLWWPGIVQYDSVEQYRQVLDGEYLDWHPPAMARLWALLHPLGPGAAPMFVLQVTLYWLGLGLLATTLARSGRRRAGLAVLALGALPLFSGWQAAVLKDTQMVAAILATVGLVAWWRLAGRRLPGLVLAAIILLLGYATLVRANAVFAVMPLVAVLAPWPRHPWRRAFLAAGGTLAIIALASPVNHRILGAGETSVARTLPIFDLVGIAHFSGAHDGLTAAERALVEQRHCYRPYFWDPLGDDGHCGGLAERLDQVPAHALAAAWLGAIARHPIAYTGHRLAHLNSTERLMVPAGRPDAEPPYHSEPNDLGLSSPGSAAVAAAQAGGWLAESPLGWPAAWIVVAMTALVAAIRRRPGPARDLALALTVSALSLEASFVVVSIASDLRYHLWPMIASALAAILLADSRHLSRRLMLLGGAALFAVLAVGTVARLALPRSPQTYHGMLG